MAPGPGATKASSTLASIPRLTSRATTPRLLGMERATGMTNMLSNHDLPRFAAAVPEEVSLAAAADRYRLALVSLFTLPGLPQLYAGDELGFLGYNRRDMPEWVWSAETRPGDHPETLPGAADTFALTAQLSRLRSANPALYRGYYAELWRQNGGPPVYGFFRGADDNRIAVVFNNGDDPARVRMPLLGNPNITDDDKQALVDGAEVTDLLGGAAPAIEDGHLVIDVPGTTAAIYLLP